MKKKKDKKVSIAKKDSVGLFSGKFISKEFGGKKDELKKEEQKLKQKRFENESEN